MTISARRPAGRPSYRVLIAAAVPILWMSVAHLGRTGAAAHDITGLETVRRPTGGLALRLPVPDVRLAQLRPPQPIGEPLSLRNPFEFVPRSLPPGARPSIAQAPEPRLQIFRLKAETTGSDPSSVGLSLIGVATTTRADGRAERTAIIAGPADALYLVRGGDAVMTRYRVDAVLPDTVLLVDDATGASLRLTMR